MREITIYCLKVAIILYFIIGLIWGVANLTGTITWNTLFM